MHKQAWIFYCIFHHSINAPIFSFKISLGTIVPQKLMFRTLFLTQSGKDHLEHRSMRDISGKDHIFMQH
jgi:hypothetical protein